jgi:hypothetical protein
VTRQLGPLPISAGVVAGLVVGLDPDSIDHKWLLWLALGLFGLLVLLSILYSNMRPYRVLRRIKEKELPEAERPSTDVTELEWYTRTLALENRIYGRDRERLLEWRLPWRIDSLQEGFERERTGLILVQSLFAVVIALLILSRVA